jgi:hypothetical protein
MEEQRDEKLWQLARRRAAFQNSLLSFAWITILCWVIWYFTAGRRGVNMNPPWPVWVMLGLGIDLFFKFMKAYKTDKDTMTEREYEKLKNNNR